MALFNIRKKKKTTSPFGQSTSMFGNPSQMSRANQNMSVAKESIDKNKKSTFLQSNDLIGGQSAMKQKRNQSTAIPTGQMSVARNMSRAGTPVQRSGVRGSMSFAQSGPMTTQPAQETQATPQFAMAGGQLQRQPAQSVIPATPSAQQQFNNRQQEGIRAGLTGQSLQRFAETGQMPTPSATPATPVAPPTPSLSISSGRVDPAQQRMANARQNFLQSIAPSEDIQRQREDLANFQASAASAIAGEEGLGRGRTTSLVRGRQALIQEQAAIEEANRIAMLNNSLEERKQMQEMALAELGFAREDVQRITEQQVPFEFGGNLVSYDPATGTLTTIAEAPETAAEGFTLSPGEARYDANGNLVAIGLQEPTDPLAQQRQMLEIQRLQQELQGGGDMNEMLTIKELNDLGIPTSYFGITKGQAANAISGGQITTASQQSAINQIATVDQRISTIDKLLQDDSGIKGAVGVGLFSRGSLRGKRQSQFKGAIDQIISQQTLQALTDLKAQGGTLGAISDAELAILQDAANKFKSWEDPKNPGRYKTSEAAFKEELQLVKDSLERVRQAAQNQLGPAQNSVDDPLNLFGDSIGDDPLGLGFSRDLNRSLNGSLGSLSEKYESGGDPGAIGYDRTGGYSYGIYQLAHNNAQQFVQQSPFASAFQGLSFNSPAWRQRWKDVAKAYPEEFKQSQHQYIKQTHFDPQVQKLAQSGINVENLPQTLLDVIWSTAVQHGPGTNIVVNALNRLPPGATTADAIRSIYNERWSGGQNFARSTPGVRQAVYNRFFGPNGEMQQALNQIA